MSRRRARRVPVAVRWACILLTLGLLLAACGGGGGGSGSTKTATGGKIDVNAFDPFRFDVKTINASPGPLTITLHEKGSTQHTFTIPDLKFEIKVTSSHPEATGQVILAAGTTYTFRCSFDAHAAAGMNGKIVVG